MYGDKAASFVHYLAEVLKEHGLPQGQKSEVCGKFKTCRAHQDDTTFLSAVSLRKRAVCSGIPEFTAYFRAAIRKCGKNRDRPTRHRFYTSATCGFITKKRFALEGFRFFPALPENTAALSVLKRKRATSSAEKQPLKRKNRLSAVPTGQAGRTVARPHHS